MQDRAIREGLQYLSVPEKEAVIAFITKLINAPGRRDWWDEISEEQRRGIKKSLAELKAGQGIPHEEVMKKVRKRLRKKRNHAKKQS